MNLAHARDRADLIESLRVVAFAAGATIVAREFEPRRVTVEIVHPSGLSATIFVDGQPGNVAPAIYWRSSRWLNPEYFGGGANGERAIYRPFFADTVPSELAHGLAMAVDGSAFLAPVTTF